MTTYTIKGIEPNGSETVLHSTDRMATVDEAKTWMRGYAGDGMGSYEYLAAYNPFNGLEALLDDWGHMV